MLFYKVTAAVDGGNKPGERLTPEERDELAVHISSGTEEFNLASKDGTYCFISGMRRGTVTCGIMSEEPVDPGRVSGRLFAALGINVGNVRCTETVFGAFLSLLAGADRYGFIESDEEVLEKHGLDLLSGRYGRGISFSENMLKPDASAESLYGSCGELVANETLRPELDRIFADICEIIDKI